MGKLKDQLAGIAALIAAVVAIGGGFATYGKLTEKISVLESKSSADYSAQIAVLEEKVGALESHEHEHEHEHGHTKILVNEKEIQLLKVQIEEIKISTSNPLAN
jgi:hypothetical protein